MAHPRAESREHGVSVRLHGGLAGSHAPFAISAGVRDPTPLQYRIGLVLVTAAVRLLFRIAVDGRERIPDGSPYIVTANHLNWLDAFALLIALPASPQVHFLGMEMVLRSAKLSWLIRTTKAGFIPIPEDRATRSRNSAALMTALTRCVADQHPVVIFPEGNAGRNEGELMPFQAGFARLAAATGVPVVPVALSGTRRLWLGKEVRVVIGTPLDPSGLSERELIARIRKDVLALMPDYRDPGGRKLFQRKLTRLIPSLTTWTESEL